MKRHHLRVAIVGAGLGGIATAINLTRAGFTDITVFEKQAGPGGVWWANIYPGCEVDVPSQAYSYSFMKRIFKRTYATQPEILSYIQDVIDRFEIRDRIRFSLGVASVRWDAETNDYLLTDEDGGQERFHVVISCLGMLSNPVWPDWPGINSFEGPVFHTARYQHDLDLTNKRVAVVGTGATACQLAPAISNGVEKLYVFQREPGYVLPKRVTDIPDLEREQLERSRFRYKLGRYRLFAEANRAQKAFNPQSKHQLRMKEFAQSYVERCVENPETRSSLTPQSSYGCKRPVFNSDFYPMFNDENVTLVPAAVSEVLPRSLITANGDEIAVDVIILATGFYATRYQSTLEVVGIDGQSLHDCWGNEPSAFMGMSVTGFPNFFMLYGPNTNGGWSIISTLERQSEVVVRICKKMVRRNAVVTARPRLSAAYDRWIQSRLNSHRLSSDSLCNNYYHAESGKNVTQMPFTALQYLLVTRALAGVGFRFRRKG